MTLTILLIGAVGIAIAAVRVATSQAYEVAPALAGENTAVGLGDPAADTLASGSRHNTPTRTEWHLTTVSALHDAEDLLDSLENQGYAERELMVLGNSTFAVRWR